jgi:hypothetical protein
MPKSPKAPVLTRLELNRATLARQMLLERADASPLKAVERLVGLQAQFAKAPFIALWSRLAGFRRADLARLFDDRKLVRATLMRATLHFMSAADYARFRMTLQPLLAAAVAGLGDRAKGIDADRVIEASVKLFQRGPSDFEALREALANKKEALEGDVRAMAYLVRTSVPLVQVPDGGAWSFAAGGTFALAESWLGGPVDPEARLADFALRYLKAFGPASVADAQTWSGLKSLKGTFDELRPKLTVFQDEGGRELFDIPDAPRPPADTPVPARFLPDFDGLLLGHADRTRVISEEHRKRIGTKNLLVVATFLVDGEVAGTWKAEKRRGTAQLAIEPFGKLKKAVRTELEAEGTRLLKFIEEDAKAFEVVFAA